MSFSIPGARGAGIALDRGCWSRYARADYEDPAPSVNLLDNAPSLLNAEGVETTHRAQRSHRLYAVLVLLLTAALTGCGLTIPADPDGTLTGASGEVLRIGVTAEPGLVNTSEEEPSGPLVDLATGFAASIDAQYEWTVASEESLVHMLETDEIDLAIGGFTDQTPWAERVGITRGYSDLPGAEGRSVVMLVPPGENAFLRELEAFLDEEAAS